MTLAPVRLSEVLGTLVAVRLDWAGLKQQIAEAAYELRPGQFIIVEYATPSGCDPEPYSQAAFHSDYIQLEVVSEVYLAASQWPIDAEALTRAGWHEPGEVVENWWRNADSAHETASLLVQALRRGRSCWDPQRFSWQMGTFPHGSDGGLPITREVTPARAG